MHVFSNREYISTHTLPWDEREVTRMANGEYEVEEYTISIPDADLEDMYDRLRRTRFP